MELLLRLFALAWLHLSMVTSSSASHSGCRDDERSALLEFKQSFTTDAYASSRAGAYPKASSWNLQAQGGDCCAWDGVECDNNTGSVVGLDLSSSFLYGSFDSDNSLFGLSGLQTLNLSDNNFNHSLIPSTIGKLSSLSRLDISNSLFSGQIPLDISYLSNLTHLDLSSSIDDPTSKWLLELKQPNLQSLIQNLTSLEYLDLQSVHVPSSVPAFLANFTSMTTLRLGNCELRDKFPEDIFRLPNLQVLDLRINENLTGHLPEFHPPSPLERLSLGGSSFSGSIPSSIENLHSLRVLGLEDYNIVGPLPSSLGKLSQLTALSLSNCGLRGSVPPFLQNLTQLRDLRLALNQFSGPIPSWLGNLNQLNNLYLPQNDFIGDIPSSFQNLTQLTQITLSDNQLSGPLPSWLGNLTQLTLVSMTTNLLSGPLPHSLSKLVDLEYLYLSENNLTGFVDFDMFLGMKNLAGVVLCESGLSVLPGRVPHPNATLSNLRLLGLCNCNLSEFPSFIMNQSNLETLLLSGNNIRGQVPRWMLNVSTETLLVMNLSSNFLTGFDQPSKQAILPWRSLSSLALNSNNLQGALPIPPPSVEFYDVSNNKLSGDIASILCNPGSIRILDLSSNSFSSTIPPCFRKLSDSLMALNLGNNLLKGSIPPLECTASSNLSVLDFSRNQLEGRLPRSLGTCINLESLNLHNNSISDVFPSWLGTLPKLKHLILRKNRFYGAIGKPQRSEEFTKLRVIDLSSNDFSGQFPTEYVSSFIAMAEPTANSTYMETNEVVRALGTRTSYHGFYHYSFTIISKGVETNYEKIQLALAVIDFSSNKLMGEIPEVLGNLKALRLLNLSHNELTGLIPQSLGDLPVLESLDLSNNKLSGAIPQQLVQLNFLQVFDVSRNKLSGRIPKGQQFGTFENSSYLGNEGLCGKPMSKTCEGSTATLPGHSTGDESNDFWSGIELDWKFVLAGLIGGLVLGLSLGDILIMKKRPGLFAMIFKRRPI